ncbi:MAG: phosphate acyltransferase PlsX [Chloroflexi bacterium]|nr:phosphate acyltransferase PlsX [Chloroflexota bacterium]
MKIAVDAAGGDYAPQAIVKGAIKAAQDYKDTEVVLVGKKSILTMLAGPYMRKTKNISIVDADEVIEDHEPPVKAVQTKLNSSIVVGTNLVRDGEAAGFVSAGSSGAVAVAALLNLGLAEGAIRPAIGSFINITPPYPVFLIDAGANAECRPEHLVWFARLGNLYVREILGLRAPRIGLLSNGQEDTKGNKLVKDTHKLLRDTSLNFIGNIEGHDILKRAAEVIVTDGFTGNIVLKTIEGICDSWLYAFTQAGQRMAKAYRLQMKSLHEDMDMSAWTKRLDYREYGGACLLGVKGTIIIAHGRSQAKAINNAIRLAHQTAEHNIAEKIKEESSER